jgi:hypothetical protein
MKVRLTLRFKIPLHDHLRDPVRNGRHASWAGGTRVACWHLDEPDRWGHIAA